MNNNTEKGSSSIAQILIWFISSGFIMQGWNTLAPYINCPVFTYWEIFFMRMALSCLMSIIWQRKISLELLD